MNVLRVTTLGVLLVGLSVSQAQDRNVQTDPTTQKKVSELVSELQRLKAGGFQMKDLPEAFKNMTPEQLEQLKKLAEKYKGMTPEQFKQQQMPKEFQGQSLEQWKQWAEQFKGMTGGASTAPNEAGRSSTLPNVQPPTLPPATPPTQIPPSPQGGPPDIPTPTPQTITPPGNFPQPPMGGEMPGGFDLPQNFNPPQFGGNPDKRFADGVLNFWEKNIGSLDETPGLKNALLDFLKDGGLSDTGKSGLSELFEKGTFNPNDLPKTDWFDKSSTLGSMKWPELGTGKLDWRLPETGLGGSMPSAPSMPSVGGGGFDLSGGGAAITPMLVLIAAVVIGVLVWKFWPQIQQLASRQTDLREQTWPFDPRTVADRAALVRAFEFLSVTLCGDTARVWNHRTIATALRTKVVGAEPVADELASLYELARYTPPDEPISGDQLAAARRCLCHLAGVNPA